MWAAFLFNPRLAAFAILGIAIGIGVGKILKIGDVLRIGGGLKANALLAAVMVAWFTQSIEISLQAQLAIATASAATASILTAAIIRLLDKTKLPSLVWGFCIVAGLLFSVCPACTELASKAIQATPAPGDAIDWVPAFFSSLGSFIFSPTYEAGLLVGFAILLWSRIMFVTGAVGWLCGAAVALAFGKLDMAYYWLPASYNYFIAGMALGSVFLLPGRTSLLIAAIGGFSASFIGFVLQGTPLAYLPVPAASTIWLIMGAVTLAGDKCEAWLNNTPLLRPEDSWWKAASWSLRFGQGEPLLAVPVAGQLHIAQGFNGTLSHAGAWRHALDFQRPAVAENSNEPVSSIWGEIVYSPAAGVIERINNNVPDNQLGISNYAENWGNYVVIRLDQGGYALLAHLQQGSIAIATGTRVEAGDYLGRVGNSGRSPIPHLHLQAQRSPEPSAPTTPFRLVNYQSTSYPDRPLHHLNAAVPPEGSIILAATPNLVVHDALASIAPGTAVWTVESQGRIPRGFAQPSTDQILRINVTLDEAGHHLFNSESHGTLITVLAPDAWRVIETRQLTSPFLKLLGMAVPSIPYAATVGMTWNDSAPIMPVGTTHWLGMSAFPYMQKKPFIFSCSKCTFVPGLENKAIQIETELKPKRSSLPAKLTCEFEILRGPVKLQVDFKHGTVVYSLLSFTPGLPLDEKSHHTN